MVHHAQTCLPALAVLALATCAPSAKVTRPECTRPVCPPPAEWRIQTRDECLRGDEIACREYGKMLYHSVGGDAKCPEARLLFQRACLSDRDAEACFNLGVMWQTGEGGPEDLNQALSYFKNACDRGFAPSCNYAPIEAVAPAQPARNRPDPPRPTRRSTSGSDPSRSDDCPACRTGHR
jgi:TPR repeat protein